MNKTQNMQQRAMASIPGMTQLYSKRPDLYSYGVWPSHYMRAEGAILWDMDGRKLADFSISGVGAAVLGYADPDIDAAAVNALRSGVCSSLNCPEEVELAEELCALHPWADMARFTRSGGEAMAMAVRIARAATGKDKIAFCGYHGWHDWYLAANLRKEVLDEHLLAGLDAAGVPKGLADTSYPFRYNNIADLEEIVANQGKELAAIVMEPMRGEEPAPGFLDQVKGLARSCDALLIFDEISSGFRLCTGGAHLTLDSVTPDMAVFSKALGNGYAISAVIGERGVMEVAQNCFISSTNWTERIGPCAALATIAKHKSHAVHETLCRQGNKVKEGWLAAACSAGIPLSVGGMAPMAHFCFTGHDDSIWGAYFTQAMLERGFLACSSFYAMFAHSDALVEEYLSAVNEVFAELAVMGDDVSVKQKLNGRQATQRFARLT